MSTSGGEGGVFAVVTGGGTAGHVLPAIAVAEGLVARGRTPGDVHYVGARRGIETLLVPRTPFPHTFFDVTGLQRRLDIGNVAVLARLWRAARAARRLLGELRPRVVVSVGGYASLPAVVAARRLRIPIVVVSYDRRAGLASRLAARWAAACAVAFADSSLPRATYTGAPVRQSIVDVDRVGGRNAARHALELPTDRFVVGVIGGSLGSAVLNGAIAAYAADHTADDGLAIYQVIGDRFIEGADRAVSDGQLVHRIVGFEDGIDRLYAAADVIVGRGGASTVAEVAATGTPAVLVPWAASAEDHQTLNVRWLADDDAAVLLPETDIGTLGEVLESLRADRPRLRALGERAWSAGERHRSGAVAGLVERVAVGLTS